MNTPANITLVGIGAAALVAAAALYTRATQAAGYANGATLDKQGVRLLARRTVENYGLNSAPGNVKAECLLTAIAKIESSFNSMALRFEPSLSTYSTGLMQTLVTTAQWLYDDMGYRAIGIYPTLDSLTQPEVSMYFGAAYVDYLSRYNGIPRGEQFIVRGYNGGPDGINRLATAPYYAKYLLAKLEVC